jgi:hypothetical protein
MSGVTLANLNLQPTHKAKTVMLTNKREEKLVSKSLLGTAKSIMNRNTNGRFEGSVKFGNNSFVKKGFTCKG